MISIIITSYKEPKTIGRAIECFLNQKTKQDFEIIISAPDEETLKQAENYAKYNSNVKLFKDAGQGKSFALNSLLPIVKGEIVILSDGDVFVSLNSVDKILEQFKDKKVGCVSGHPVSINSRKKLFGYWSHLLCFSAHKLRQMRNESDKFLECSGYLWAFRNNIIKNFPVDVAEDTIVPILFYKKNWKIKYAEEAEVFVKFPSNLKDFLIQKKRTTASHETISKYVNEKDIPRMKTFFNEIAGSFLVLSYPKSIKEMLFSIMLFPIRLYVWMNIFFNTKFKKKKYSDSWKRVESTK